MQYSYNPADSKSVRRCYAAEKDRYYGDSWGIPPLITSHPSGVIANALIPYDIFNIPGMCPMTDPIAALFFLSPFALAFAGTILFDFMHVVLKGKKVRKGVVFGHSFSSWLQSRTSLLSGAL
jgi:hypothetical protein